MGHTAVSTNGGAAHVLHTAQQPAQYQQDSIEMRGRQNLFEAQIGGTLNLYFASAAVWSVKTDQVPVLPVVGITPAPSVLVPMREAAAFADLPELPVEPSFAVQEETQFETITHRFHQHYLQSWPKFTMPRRMMRLTWENVIAADKETLVSFLQSSSGGLTAFRWTPPGDGAEGAWVTNGGDLTMHQLHPSVWTLEAEVYELVFVGA
jgi:hypothetical protein